MAFANLFTKLCDVQEAVKDSCKADLSNRSEYTDRKGGPSRKRKKQAEQTGPYLKKHCFQAAASWGVSSEVLYNPKDKAPCHNQSERVTNNVKKKKKKNKGKKKEEMAKRYRRQNHPNKHGRGRNEPPPKRPMTQEFKDQNVLEVDGRFICIHHLYGRCIKGEACQLEHIQGYNDLIKEACKFYIQGFCVKGETCPYMHQSFPCKFFHKKRSCRRDNCKFSHDPLNDFTEKLLDDAIKRENELLELNKKVEQEPLGQNENVSTTTEENLILQPIRPNFYQSSDTNIDEEALPAHTEQEAATTEDTLLQTETDVEPDNVTPSSQNDPGPVCYSVEAMLGPQLYKPCFYTNKSSPESSHVQKTTSNSSSNHLNAPYSVTNVLRSQSRLSTASYLPPITQTVATTSKLKGRDDGEGLDKTKVSQLHNIFTYPLNTMSVDSKKDFENETLKLTKMSSESKETNKSILTNPLSLNNPGTSVSERFPPKRSTYPAKNCETSKQQVKATLSYPDSKQTTASMRTSDASSTTNQATPIHPNLQKRNSGQSLDTQQSDCIEHVPKNRQGSVLGVSLATSCDKTCDKTSPVSSSATTKSKVQHKGHCGNLDSECNKTATRKCPSLFASLHSNVANEPTSAQSLQKDQSVKTLQVCGSKFTENTSCNNEEVGVDFVAKCSETSNIYSQKSSSLTPLSKGGNIKDTTGFHKTSAKSFSSLFAAPLSKSSPTKDSTSSKSSQKTSQSIASSEVTTESKNNSVGAYLVAACSETSNEPCQKSVSSSPNSKGEETKTHAKSFTSLFAAPLNETFPNESPISKKSIDETAQPSDLKVNDKISYHKSSSENKKTEPCFGTKENSNEHGKNTVCSTSSSSSNETSTSQGALHTTDGSSHNVLRSLFQSLGPYMDPHQIQPNVQPVTKPDYIDVESDPAYQPKKHKCKNKAASPSPPPKYTTVICAPGTSLTQTRTDYCEHQSQDTTAGPTLKDIFKTLNPLKQ